MGGSQSATKFVFAVSDLHTDHRRNWELVQGLEQRREELAQSVIIVAGDVSTDLTVLRRTLRFLKGLFLEVFFVPGNNELRLTEEEAAEGITSLEKFARVLAVCEQEGVRTSPATIFDSVRIVPLFSWYSPTFEAVWDGDTEYQRHWLDFRTCVWPQQLTAQANALSEHFRHLNEKHIGRAETANITTISFSHFLPRRELLSLMPFISNKTLPLVAGDSALDTQIRALGSAIHVFGHTHMNQQTQIDDVTYIQNAFGHPSERRGLNLQRLCETPKVIWSK